MNKRPQYEERYHTRSETPCPVCGGNVWVDFGVLRRSAAKPISNSVLFWPRRAYVDWRPIHQWVAECVQCGAVLS